MSQKKYDSDKKETLKDRNDTPDLGNMDENGGGPTGAMGAVTGEYQRSGTRGQGAEPGRTGGHDTRGAYGQEEVPVIGGDGPGSPGAGGSTGSASRSNQGLWGEQSADQPRGGTGRHTGGSRDAGTPGSSTPQDRQNQGSDYSDPGSPGFGIGADTGGQDRDRGEVDTDDLPREGGAARRSDTLDDDENDRFGERAPLM